MVSKYLAIPHVTTDIFLEYGNEQAEFYTDVFPN